MISPSLDSLDPFAPIILKTRLAPHPGHRRDSYTWNMRIETSHRRALLQFGYTLLYSKDYRVAMIRRHSTMKVTAAEKNISSIV